MIKRKQKTIDTKRAKLEDYRSFYISRSEYLQWCKDRANEYINNGDLTQAFASFQSDMRKHIETMYHISLELGIMLLASGNLSTQNQMKEWIDGTN